MSEFFKGFLSREIVSLTVMLAVLLARLLFRRAPKRLTVALWAVVCFRLLCPVSIDAPVSLVPKAAEQAANAVEDLPASDELVTLRQRSRSHYIVNHNDRALTARQWGNLALELAPYVWLLGMAALALSQTLKLLRLRRQLQTAQELSPGVYRSDRLTCAFVLGLFRPRIYLPAGLSELEQRYVLLHEKTHIKHCDHVWKLLALLCLCLHWFDPMVWLCWGLFGRDLELACDEASTASLSPAERCDYAQTLLTLSGENPAFPLPAFSQPEPETRIRRVLNRKKPARIVCVLALVLVLLLGTGLAVNPHLKESIFNRRYAISQLLYSSPQYDYAYRPGDYLGFALSGDRVLYARRSSRISAEGFPESGELREVTLPDWYLRGLFCDGWVDNALLKELSKAQTAWVTQRKGERNFSFYLVLQNGKTVYLALCHGLWDTNTAGIRWLFELTRDERTFVTEDLQNLLQETMGEFDEDAPPLISASYQSDTLPGVLVARFTGVRKGIDIAGTAIFLDEGSLFGPTLRQVTSDDGTHDFSSQTIWLRDVGKTFTVVTASPDRTDLYEVRASWDGTTQRKYVVYHQSILVVFEWDEKFSSHAYDATSPDIRFYNLDGEELSRE